METIGDYIQELITSLRLPIGSIQLATLFLKNNIVASDEMSLESIEMMDIAILEVIPQLLLVPDKKTGDTSITWDKEAIINYYNLRTDQLGLPNMLSQENSITGLNNIW